MQIKQLIDKILITLEVEEKTSVFILLGKDGTISRKGDGSTSGTSLSLAQGVSHDGHFDALMMTVSEDIFNHTGVFKQTPREGRECSLSIIFQGPHEVDYSFRMIYGEDSQGPPIELAQILINAVKITEAWYQAQLNTNEEPEKKWWQVWK